jgi:hypothetical protein
VTWFKVDDKLWGHPKWLATPPRARGLWVTAGSWSAGLGQDGNIPKHVLPTLGHTARDAAALVTSGLWRTTRDGWRFHGWAEFQPDAASEKAKRDAASDGGALGNHKRWHTARGINVASCGYCSGASGTDRVPESPPNPPDPSRPDPITDEPKTSSSIVTFVPRAAVDGR